MERRTALCTAGSALATALAGCSNPLTSTQELAVSVENYRSDPVEPLLEVLRRDASDRSDALVYQKRIDVPAGATGDDAWRADAVAPVQPLRVEVVVDSEKTYHYHYVPDCTGDDPPYEPRINLILNDESGVAFGQTGCSGDVASAP